MPTISELFRILPLIQYSELALFHVITNSFDYSSYTHAGSYPRGLLYVDGGVPRWASITVFRVRVKGSLSGRTLSIRPEFFIPNTSYTIGAVITMLHAFHNRSGSISSFCAEWQVSYPSIRYFEEKFASDASLWKKTLISMKDLCLRLHSGGYDPSCSVFTSPGDPCPMLFDAADRLPLHFIRIPP